MLKSKMQQHMHMHLIFACIWNNDAAA
jgi:hypothetical protein